MSVKFGQNALTFSDNSKQTYASKIVQAVSSTLTSITTVTGDNVWTNIGVSASITPKSSSNRIMVLFSTNVSSSDYGRGTVVPKSFRLLRNSTQVGMGDSRGVEVRCLTAVSSTYAASYPVPVMTHYMDSPSTTNSTTYTMQMMIGNSGGATACIGGGYDSGSNLSSSTPTSLILLEIAP
jgi:hypothetical protein